MTVRIKNWSKLQHFKDRTPPWIKLYRDLLDDPDWHDLDGETAKILVGLWLIASEDERKEGTLPDARKLAFRLRIDASIMQKALARLSHWLEQDDITVISTGYQIDTPETETETETKKETKAHSAQGGRRKKKETTSIPEDLLPSIQRLCKEWPSQSLGQPGPGGAQKKQDLAKWTDPVDLWERWREWWPETEPTLLAECGVAYLESLEYIEDEWSPKKYPKFCYAMRNFYGEKAYWKLMKGKALERISNALRQH